MEELLLGVDETLQPFAGELDQAVPFILLTGFDGSETSMHLLTCALQVIQLHLYEGVNAAPNGFDQSIGNGESAGPLLHTGCQNFTLPLCQSENQFLAFDEVGQPLSCEFFDHRDRAKIRRRQLFAHNIDYSPVLAYRQVYQYPLRSKEVLNSLLHPSR